MVLFSLLRVHNLLLQFYLTSRLLNYIIIIMTNVRVIEGRREKKVLHFEAITQRRKNSFEWKKE